MDKLYIALAIIAYSCMAIFYFIELIHKTKEKKYSAQKLSLLNPTSESLGLRISRNNFQNACLWGGFFAGFTGSSIILILYLIRLKPAIGYQNINSPEIIIIVFLLQCLTGILIGKLCANFSLAQRNLKRNSIKKYFRLLFIFILGFLITFLFRQLATRDGLKLPGSYISEIKDLNELNSEHLKCIDQKFKTLYKLNEKTHTYFRNGGGYFGEPNFESIANGCMGGTAFLFFILNLSNLFKKNIISQNKILSLKGMLSISIKASFLGFTAWIFVYTVYHFLVVNCFIHKFHFIGAPWFFIYDFPHPERFLTTFLLCLIYLFSFFASIRLYSVHKKDRKQTKRIIKDIKLPPK